MVQLIAEQSAEELARRRAAEDIIWPLRELACNLMRVARGAGKPQDVGKHAAAVVDSFEKYAAVSKLWPSPHEIATALTVDSSDDGLSDRPYDELDQALTTMMLGGLQMAASELLGQLSQKSAGRSQLFEGLQRAEKIREANRRDVMRPGKFTNRLQARKAMSQLVAETPRIKRRPHPVKTD